MRTLTGDSFWEGWKMWILKKSDNVETEHLAKRIDELGKKSSQVLLFLSFAMVSVATLEAVKGLPVPKLNYALFLWKLALFPVLVSVLPMKEIRWDDPTWYLWICRIRYCLLWLAVVVILGGVGFFLLA